ncbi:hypothetical protein BZG35_03445 [Brevundimonas sp. LM2]|uniref:hypothetical protein n=1 Tax=Brevundimonas sp. LM2 TaxID=1938605 RepID=UPI000983C104|nr:hypothetical protein [Brevundimonas sp. LM2]AQR60812.1 hypothetical protein BZG35_03445 [Brevundimonas sp. LM2]
MMLSTTSGSFPIPASVASKLPQVPPIPSPGSPDYAAQAKSFNEWLDESPAHTIDFERLRRWHLVQDELAAKAVADGQDYLVTDDGLE